MGKDDEKRHGKNKKTGQLDNRGVPVAQQWKLPKGLVSPDRRSSGASANSGR